jgi:thiopeptide-type bacteriocin biosynthesis protein
VALRPQNGSFAEPAYRLFEAVTSLVKDLEKSGQLQSYFFMRKDPGLRLRFCLGAGAGGAISAVESSLETLRKAKAVAKWVPSVYEPETYKFGGPEAMAAVHEHFYGDSSAWWRWEKLKRAGRTRIESRLLSASVLNHLFAAFLDGPEEVWDVWCRLATLHGASIVSEGERPVVLGIDDLLDRVTPDEQRILRSYASINRSLARRFRVLGAKGKLLYVNRLVLPHVAIHHWNRYGFSPDHRASIFTAMMRAFSPHGAGVARRDDSG